MVFIGLVVFFSGIYALWRGKFPWARANKNDGAVTPRVGSKRALVTIASGLLAMSIGAASASTVDPQEPTPIPSPSPLATSRPVATLPSPVPSPSKSPSPEPTPVVQVAQASVVRIIDGDTIEIRFMDGAMDKLRLIGVDTPEKGDAYGAEATAYTSSALTGKQIWIEKDAGERDRYSRLLGYVWLNPPLRGDDGDMRTNLFNAKLLLDGYAKLMTIPPNVKYVDMFTGYQASAREQNKGLWGITVAPVAPAPAAPAPAPAAPASGENCDPSYPDVCIAPAPPDLDCPEIPYKDFRVLQPDPHGFDGNKDGVGCES